MLSKIKKIRAFKNIQITLKTNADKWKFIGSGVYGRAYDMGDGRVCKITTNKREIKVAKKIKQHRKTKFVYNILNILSMESGEKEFGLIITPKYKKLSRKERAELDKILFLIEPSTFRYKSNQQIKKIIIKRLKQERRVPQCRTKKCKCAKQNLANLATTYFNLFKKYNIDNILKNLLSMKIRPDDIHYNNILRNKNYYILIDVAC